MRSLAIYGAGNLGREVIELAREINNLELKWSEIFFVDALLSGSRVSNSEVLKLESLSSAQQSLDAGLDIVIANGDPVARMHMFREIEFRKLEKHLCNLVSPKAEIANSVQIGVGTIVFAGVGISVGAKIGKNCLIYRHSLLGHDVTVEDNVVVSSKVSIAGHVYISSEVFIGMGSLIRERVSVGRNSVIGMGSCLHDNVPEKTLVFGNPAKPIRSIEALKLYKD